MDPNEIYPTSRSIGTKTMEMLEVGLTRAVRTEEVHRKMGSFSTENLAITLKETALGMQMSLATMVLTDKLPPVEVDRKTTAFFAFPSSPFQHWKQKHADAWWLRRFVKRWPVWTTQHAQEVRLIVHLQRYRSYPEADVPVPDSFGPVRFGYSLSEHIVREP